MIYTVTCNPSVDYHMDLGNNSLLVGEINRAEGERAYPGGKGLNVSIILYRLGIESKATGFVAGRAGEYLCGLIRDMGCQEDFIRMSEGETRINVKLDCETETAVNGCGPQVDRTSVNMLLDMVWQTTPEDMIILCGRAQEEIKDIYALICEITPGRVIVDTSGQALRDTFGFHPWLIKPNLDELCELFGQTDPSEAEVLQMMKKCQDEGVRNVLVSMGGDGALLLNDKNMVYRACLQNKRPVRSTVGAGDSMLAGFIAGMLNDPDDCASALRLACAAGTATAYTTWLSEREEIEEQKKNVRVS